MATKLFQAIEYIAGVSCSLKSVTNRLKEQQGLVEVLHVEGKPNGSTKIILYSTKKNFQEMKKKYGRNMSGGAIDERDCNKLLAAINSAGFTARRVRFKNKAESKVMHHLSHFPFTVEVF